MGIMAATRIHGVVTGRVQGVFFRASLREQAERLGLGGWVRNRPDGRVEFEAEGEAGAVAALVDWAHTGPPTALVTRVETHPVPLASEGVFRVL